MSKVFPLTVIITSCSLLLCAQSSSTLMGARASGTGYASACHTDVWSVFNNVGGLAGVKHPSSSFAYDALPAFTPFNKAAFALALPLKIGAAGFGVYRFGDKIYNEQIISTGFGTQFGLASLGVKLNYIQYNAQGFGRKAIFSLSLGGIAQLTPILAVGAHITNINQPRLTDTDDERLPTILAAGIMLKASDKTSVAMEIEKDLSYKATWKMGVEYQALPKFCIRSGVNLYPNSGFFGLGFKQRNLTLDYAYAYRVILGGRHQVSVGYTIDRSGK